MYDIRCSVTKNTHPCVILEKLEEKLIDRQAARFTCQTMITSARP